MLNRLRISWFTLSLLILFLSTTALSQKMGTGNNESCNENQVLIDRLVALRYEIQDKYPEKDSNMPIIVIASLGTGERLQRYNLQRLNEVRNYLRRTSPLNDELIKAQGEKAKGQGRVDFYLNGELYFSITLKRNQYSFSDCKYRAMRFYVASLEAGGIDIAIVRLRGIKEGQLVIEAQERGIEQMRVAGFDKNDHRMNTTYEHLLSVLEEQKGINSKDRIIMDTLRVRYKIQMTEAEFLEFSNFLTSLDPTYPGWSEVNADSDPLIMKNSEKYYQAYLKFKTKN